MNHIEIPDGVVHKVPEDLRKALLSNPKSLATWNTITPLARNEWICWVEYVMQAETRRNHIERVCSELLEGKHRPCCWIGCIHRTDKAVSPSIQGILSKNKSPNR